MTFLASGAAIYNTMKHEGTLRDWMGEDYNSLLSPLLNSGFQWDANTERLKIPSQLDMRKLVYTTPWCHAKGTPRKHCGMDHQITFNHFHIIHPRCMSRRSRADRSGALPAAPVSGKTSRRRA